MKASTSNAERPQQQAEITSSTGYLSRKASDEFLIRLYFGPGSDYLVSCIDRAYLDFNRTLHGFASHGQPVVVRAGATALLKKRVGSLVGAPGLEKAAFDRWHLGLCKALRTHFRHAGFEAFSVGQAQKWVTMTLKYVL